MEPEKPEGTQQKAPPPTDPTASAPSTPTLEELSARLAKFEENHAKTTGKLGQVTRERNALQAAKDLDAETLAALTRAEALEERETSIIAREYGVDPELLKPWRGLEAKEAAAQKMQSGTLSQLKELKEQLAKLQEAKVPAEQDRNPSPGGGGVPSPDGITSYQEALRNGKSLPSKEEIDRMTATYLRQR